MPNIHELLDDDTARTSVSLNLSRRNIEALPDDIGTLRHLEILSLANNKLTSLPSALNGLSSLRYLNLRSNLIREFPMVRYGLMKYKDLSRNKMKRLPQSFGNLITLKVLSIARNRIQTLPLYIGRMARLEVLKLDGNPIQWPPPDILNCTDDENADEWLGNLKQFFIQKDQSAINRELSTETTYQKDDLTTRLLTANAPQPSTDTPHLTDGSKLFETLDFRFGKRGSKDCHSLVELFLSHINATADPADEAVRSLSYGISQFYGLIRSFSRLEEETSTEVLDRSLTELNRRMIAVMRVLLERVSSSSQPSEDSSETSAASVRIWEEFVQIVEAALQVAASALDVTRNPLFDLDRRLLRNLICSIRALNLELRMGLQHLTVAFSLPLRKLPGRWKGLAQSDEAVIDNLPQPAFDQCLESADTSVPSFISVVTKLKELPPMSLRILDRYDSQEGNGEGVGFLNDALQLARELSNAREKVLVNLDDLKARTVFVSTVKRFIETSVELITRAKAVSVEVGLSKEIKLGLQNVTRQTRGLASALYSN
ncbi:hypothetical protein HDU67_007415 [Dinochytrium kinnereticum]|nr:hypothetical protein HDU67_007415 [Dinochytrium kinnereticum]